MRLINLIAALVIAFIGESIEPDWLGYTVATVAFCLYIYFLYWKPKQIKSKKGSLESSYRRELRFPTAWKGKNLSDEKDKEQIQQKIRNFQLMKEFLAKDKSNLASPSLGEIIKLRQMGIEFPWQPEIDQVWIESGLEPQEIKQLLDEAAEFVAGKDETKTSRLWQENQSVIDDVLDKIVEIQNKYRGKD